jgi:phosphate transport system substrate-binding protein
MLEPRSPFPSGSHQEFLTIRISKLTLVNGFLALTIVLALVALGFRERKNNQVALAGAPVTPQEHAIASPPVVESRPQAAGTPRIAAPFPEASSPDPAPLPENRAQAEAAIDSSVANSSEAVRVEIAQRQSTYFELRAVKDTADTQPESKPEDLLPQPADQPDQPVAPPPPAPNPQPVRPGASASPMVLNGAGANYPYPLYSKWFDDYHKVNPQVQINYQSVGSGAGVRALLTGIVEFGATDVPAFDEQLAQAKTQIMHIPAVLGAIVPVYSIPGVSREVMFTPEVLAGIYMGRIVSWSDPAIANVNPAMNLPNMPIVVIHRAEGNAATYVFTDYLCKVSRDWQEKVGKGSSVNWPVGSAAKGDEGVAGLMRQTPGAIGYVDLVYVEQNRLPFGSVSNAAGRFVKATLHTVAEAAATVTELPPNAGISITNAPGRDAYPIASFTWFLVPKKSNDSAKGQDLAVFLDWMIDAGQPVAQNLGYVPIPRKLAVQVRKMISQIR